MKRYIKSSSSLDDGRYSVEGYYGSDYRGLADDFQSDDWSEIEEHAHEMLSNGLFVEITDLGSGQIKKNMKILLIKLFILVK